MVRKYFSLERYTDNKKIEVECEVLYYGADEEKAFTILDSIVKKKDISYMILGKTFIEGECSWMLDKGRYIVFRKWEDDDGSDETWND